MWTDEQISKAAESIGEDAAEQMRSANAAESKQAADARRATLTDAVKANEAYKSAHPRALRALEAGTAVLPEGIEDAQVPAFLTAKEAEYEAMGVPAAMSATPPPTSPGVPGTIQPWGGTGEPGEQPPGVPSGPFVSGTPGYANSGEEMQAYANVEDLMIVEPEDVGKFTTGRDRDRKLVMAIELANKMPGRESAMDAIKERHQQVPPGMSMRSSGRSGRR